MNPDLPCRSLPDSCGAAQCAEYAHLVELYDKSSGDTIRSPLVKMAFLVAQTPAAEHVPRFWETLRTWNATEVGIKFVSCQRCGEFRAACLQGEARVSQHWDIVGFEPPHTYLMAAHNCNHQSFRVSCLTCGMEITTPIVVKLVDRPAPPTSAEASHVN